MEFVSRAQNQLSNVENYQVFVAKRKKYKDLHVTSIIDLNGMAFQTDPMNYLVSRKDPDPNTPAKNVFIGGLHGNVMTQKRLEDILSLDKQDFVLLILTHGIPVNMELVKTFLDQDNGKLTHVKMEVLKGHVVDSISTGGESSSKPCNLIPALDSPVVAKTTYYSGAFSLSKCGLQDKPFHSRGFLSSKATYAQINDCSDVFLDVDEHMEELVDHFDVDLPDVLDEDDQMCVDDPPENALMDYIDGSKIEVAKEEILDFNSEFSCPNVPDIAQKASSRENFIQNELARKYNIAFQDQDQHVPTYEKRWHTMEQAFEVAKNQRGIIPINTIVEKYPFIEFVKVPSSTQITHYKMRCGLCYHYSGHYKLSRDMYTDFSKKGNYQFKLFHQ